MLNDYLAALGNKKAIRRQAALKVKEAFDGVSWRVHTFAVNGIGTLSADGEKEFYKRSEIDAAIKRLNKVLSELNDK